MTAEEDGLEDRFARIGDDRIAVRITRRERSILRALLDDLEPVLAAPPAGKDVEGFTVDALPGAADADGSVDEAADAASDPDAAVRARLYPSAIPHDELADAVFRRLVHADLEAGRRERLASVLATLDAPEIDDAQAQAWLGVLNDLRLVMGTRLDVTDESERQPIDPDDPDAAARMVFAYVGWLLGQLVDVVAAALPDAVDIDGT